MHDRRGDGRAVVAQGRNQVPAGALVLSLPQPARGLLADARVGVPEPGGQPFQI
jgi:hypothetical protein